MAQKQNRATVKRDRFWVRFSFARILVMTLSAALCFVTQHETSRKLDEKWETKCLNAVSPLIYTSYSVKLHASDKIFRSSIAVCFLDVAFILYWVELYLACNSFSLAVIEPAIIAFAV